MSDARHHNSSLTDVLAAIHHATVSAGMSGTDGGDVSRARALRDYAAQVTIALPPPLLLADLATTLRARRSRRAMSGSPLSLAELSTLLAYGAGAAGETTLPSTAGAPVAERTYPSGGALYPIELLVCALQVADTAVALFRYQVLAHRLAIVSRPLAIPPAALAMLPANDVEGASVILLAWMDLSDPALARYGALAYRLALLEAGHIAQNLLLVATALGLASVPLCGFDEAAVAIQCGLAHPRHVVPYAIAVGRTT